MDPSTELALIKQRLSALETGGATRQIPIGANLDFLWELYSRMKVFRMGDFFESIAVGSGTSWVNGDRIHQGTGIVVNSRACFEMHLLNWIDGGGVWQFPWTQHLRMLIPYARTALTDAQYIGGCGIAQDYNVDAILTNPGIRLHCVVDDLYLESYGTARGLEAITVVADGVVNWFQILHYPAIPLIEVRNLAGALLASQTVAVNIPQALAGMAHYHGWSRNGAAGGVDNMAITHMPFIMAER